MTTPGATEAPDLTLKEWDEASAEQRRAWLVEGRLLSVDDCVTLGERYQTAVNAMPSTVWQEIWRTPAA